MKKAEPRLRFLSGAVWGGYATQRRLPPDFPPAKRGLTQHRFMQQGLKQQGLKQQGLKQQGLRTFPPKAAATRRRRRRRASHPHPQSRYLTPALSGAGRIASTCTAAAFAARLAAEQRSATWP